MNFLLHSLSQTKTLHQISLHLPSTRLVNLGHLTKKVGRQIDTVNLVMPQGLGNY